MRVRAYVLVWFSLPFLRFAIHEVKAEGYVPNLTSAVSIGASHVGGSRAAVLSGVARTALNQSLAISFRYTEPLLELSEDRGSVFDRSSGFGLSYRIDVVRVIPHAEVYLGGRWGESAQFRSLELGGGLGFAYVLTSSWSLDLSVGLSLFDHPLEGSQLGHMQMLSIEYGFSFGDSFDDI